MAERRMFAKKIVESDSFLDMPSNSQALYFHLCMNADDDGFINNPKKIQRMVGCNEDDYRCLIDKKFIITFDSGIIVIKHWKMHNYIQSDRYRPTDYQDEIAMLNIKKNKAYTFKEDNVVVAEDVKEKVERDPSVYKEIIDYLNQKASTKYRSTGKATRRYIETRLNENFLIEDFKTVIDKKCSEWMNTEMQSYLRPQTLFGTKFESYLNQKVGRKKNQFNNFEQKDMSDELDKLNEIFEQEVNE